MSQTSKQQRLGKNTSQKVPLLTLSNKQPEPHASFWRAPLTLGACAAMAALILAPLVQAALTPLVSVLVYIDVSESNQPFKAEVQALCRGIPAHLVEGLWSSDRWSLAKTADTVFVEGGQTYAGQKDSLKSSCDYVMTPPTGVGTHQGSPISLAVASAQTEIQQQQMRGSSDRNVVILGFQASETGETEIQLNPSEFKAQVETITSNGSVVLVFTTHVELQRELKATLAPVKGVRICSYQETNDCLSWGFNLARWQKR